MLRNLYFEISVASSGEKHKKTKRHKAKKAMKFVGEST